MKEKEDSRMTPYFTPYHHLLPVVFHLLFHLSMFLSTLQSITTLVPSTVGSSHSTTVIFSKHKSCQWVTIYFRKRTKLPYMVTSWSFLPLWSHHVPGPSAHSLHTAHPGFCPSSYHYSFHRKDFVHEILLPFSYSLN